MAAVPGKRSAICHRANSRLSDDGEPEREDSEDQLSRRLRPRGWTRRVRVCRRSAIHYCIEASSHRRQYLRVRKHVEAIFAHGIEGQLRDLLCRDLSARNGLLACTLSDAL